MKAMINTATLTKHITDHGQVPATAIQIEGIEGHVLEVVINDEVHVLSTWRSNHGRAFKRADSLLKEAKKMGLTSVVFQL